MRVKATIGHGPNGRKSPLTTPRAAGAAGSRRGGQSGPAVAGAPLNPRNSGDGRRANLSN